MPGNRDILRCLPLLASVLGRRYGVSVHVGGNRACTDGKTIRVPSLPMDDNDEWLALARGYLDHEAAHIRHTDFAAMREARLDALTGNLFNALEDWRVEKCLSAIFPGCRRNLNWLIRRFFTELPRKAGEISPAFLVSRHVLLTVRSWDVPEVAAALKESRAQLWRLDESAAHHVESILEQVRTHCPDTAAAIAWARRLAACVPSGTEASPEESGRGKDVTPTEVAGPSQEHNTGPGSAVQTGDAQMTDALHAGREDMAARESEAGDVLPPQLGEWLEERLSAYARDHPSQETEVAACRSLCVDALSETEKSLALRSSQALRVRLHGLLQAQAARRCRPARHGRLHGGSLHRFATGNPRLFLSECRRPALNTAVHILLDCSGSMSGEAMCLARQACFAVAVALDGIRGVNPAVTAFPAGRGTNDVFPLLRHGERMTDRFAVHAAGGTPLGPALWHVLQALQAQPEERKILLILTDGVPDAFRPCELAIHSAIRLGVEVCGIGIRHAAIRRLLPDRSNVISTLTELAPAIFRLLQTHLLQGDDA